MSEMGYIVRCAILHAQEKLQQTVSQYKILCFDRNRYKHQIQFRIRKQHSECQQDTEYPEAPIIGTFTFSSTI